MPLISVVLICFDRDKYIIDAIKSVIENKDQDTEIILSTCLINDIIIKIAQENSIKTTDIKGMKIMLLQLHLL